MQAIAERHARPNAKRFDRPYRDGPVFLHHFPVRSAGLVLLKSYPSREGRSSDAGNRLSGMRDQTLSDSIVPTGTDLSFCIIPSTSYWATFTESLPPSPLL
jgi:hypothetical protein